MRRPPFALLFLAALLALYLIAPFAAGVAQLGMADWGTADWSSLAGASGVSLVSATLATMLVGIGGIPLGYLLARVPGRGMGVLGFVVQLPLALPPLSSGVLLLFLLGYSSPLGRVTQGALTDSMTGIVLAEAFVAAPFLIIAARSAFAGQDRVLDDVAATLGHWPWSVFVRVSLPLAARAILAGLLLTWLRAFGEFGATVMVAYHPYSLPVYTYVAFGSQGLPAMLPVLLPTLIGAVFVMAAADVVGLPRRGPANAAAAVSSNAGSQVPAALLPAPASPSLTLGPRPLLFAFSRQLDGFTLDVAWHTQARRLAILGASGSGKSMTLRLIAGLDRARQVSLYLDGRDLSAVTPELRRCAYVPQSYGLFPHMTVERQLLFAVEAERVAADRWTERLGLSGLEQRLPSALSLGQQQRVALARAFSRPADLLLLDEPFSALDTPLRRRLRRELRALQTQIDAVTILVTHDPEEAFLLADELLVLDAGRVLQAGSVETVFARPASETVARLLGAERAGSARVVGSNRVDIGGALAIDVAGPELLVGARVGWSVASDRVRIGGQGGYPAEVTGIGPVVAGRREVVVRLGEAELSAVVGAAEAVDRGPCFLGVDPSAVQVWAEA